MAYQLFYTSARHGLTDHSGFQFVALSEGTTAEHMRQAKRHLDYRPPYSAPSRPTPEDLEKFPVAFGYCPSPLGQVFSLCRYLGSDYSGRPGNFLGIAVIATAAEMSGALPIEMWQAAWWPDTVPQGAPTGALPPLEVLRPGEAVTPESAADLIRADVSGRRGTLLAEILDSMLTSQEGGPGVTVLVSDDSAGIISWLAALSYSLTTDEALQLSFVSFSREPDRAVHLVQVIGTTPEAWTTAGRPGRAFLLDGRDRPGEPSPASAYARLISDHWQENDLAALDRLIQANAEIVGPYAGTESAGQRFKDRDGVAGLVQLARGRLLTVDEQVIRGVLRRRGNRVPPWLWSDLTKVSDIPTGIALLLCEAARDAPAPGACAKILANCVAQALEQPARRSQLRPLTGLDAYAIDRLAGVVSRHLTVTADLDDLVSCIGIAEMYSVHLGGPTVEDAAESLTPRSSGDLFAAATAVTTHRGPLLAGFARGLELQDDPTRRNRLTPEFCDLLAVQSWTVGQWSRAPKTGCQALAVRCQLRPGSREEATRRLAELSSPGIVSSSLLRSTLGQIWARGPSVRQCLGLLSPQDGQHPPREVTDLASSAWSVSGVAGPDAQALADRVLALRLDPAVDKVAADAKLVCLTTQMRQGNPDELRRMAREVAWYRRRATSAVADGVISQLMTILVSMRHKPQAATAREYADIIGEVAATGQPAGAAAAARELLEVITPPRPPLGLRRDRRAPGDEGA